MSDSGKKYGTEYRTIRTIGNIKFITQNNQGSVSAPLETKTRGRVYATIDKAGRINTISYYDTAGKRTKSINLLHGHKNIKGPHTHVGYYHAEYGTRRLTDKERRLIDRVSKAWENTDGRS